MDLTQTNDDKNPGKKRKLLITGATGLVGSYFCRLPELTRSYDVVTLDHAEPSRLAAVKGAQSIPVNLQDIEKAYQIIQKIEPASIMNFAAMTNVDGCEIERDAADRINHLFVKKLANYLESNEGCHLVHVSTDYVFDGEKGNYSEEDKTNPLGWYGMTKLLAEEELARCSSKNWCIARTSTPFGIHDKKQSFPLFVIENLRNKKELRVLEDQITSPTYAQNLAEMLLEIMTGTGIQGILHVSGSTAISRFDQAIKIASSLDLDKQLIKPSTMAQMNWKAKRPRDSSLNVSKASKMLHLQKPLNFSDGLLRFATELNSYFVA